MNLLFYLFNELSNELISVFDCIIELKIQIYFKNFIIYVYFYYNIYNLKIHMILFYNIMCLQLLILYDITLPIEPIVKKNV